MGVFSPRIAPGIGTAMARVAERFYIFSVLLVGSTIFLPHPAAGSPRGLSLLALLTAGVLVLYHVFPWDKYEPRVFTFAHVFSSSTLLALLVYFTGGLHSSYGVLFFLIILFSYFYNFMEMMSIATVVTLFYLLPCLYDKPGPRQYGATSVVVMFFYLGTYVLYGVTRLVLKKNHVLEDLNTRLSELYDISADLFRDMENKGFIDALSERLRDHLPSTYCIVMLLDDKLNLVTRVACPIRTLRWEPLIGMTYAAEQLKQVRAVLETRQPKLFQPDFDEIDADLQKIITRETRTLLLVPIRIAAENAGVLLFGEERNWEREPFSHEKIQLAVAISRQVAAAVNISWCYERLAEARHNLGVAHDKVIKSERLATLGEVTRAVEHEINNPLNVIVNWADIYREDETIDPEIRTKFQMIFDMAVRIGSVVKKLSEVKDMKSVEFTKGQKMTDLGPVT